VNVKLVALAPLLRPHRDRDEVLREISDRLRRLDIHVSRAVREVERSRLRCPPPVDDSPDAGC
jgi:hypothetical protein